MWQKKKLLTGGSVIIEGESVGGSVEIVGSSVGTIVLKMTIKKQG